MNQRLKEIMLAHGLHKNISADCQHRMEMLAELIVRECADIADRAEPYKANDLIKQHFGVEL
jgi:hypothetical protein